MFRSRIERSLAFALALLLAGLGAAGVAAKAPRPTLAETPVDERSYQASVVQPHAGRVLLVSFWASYCLPCVEELPALVQLRQRLARQGADLVFVNVDGPEAPRAMRTGVLERHAIALGHSFVATVAEPAPFLAAVDPAWDGQVPFHVLYGRDGQRLPGLPGDATPAVLEAAARAALEAAPAPRPQ